MLYYQLGYHDQGNSFGVLKKGEYICCSDFHFEFVAEVVCEDPHSSGFIVELNSESGEDTSRRYVNKEVLYLFLCTFCLLYISKSSNVYQAGNTVH